MVRGYSGYNTRWAVKVLDKVFPAVDEAAPVAVTVFFGANDSCLHDRYAAFQHVPLDEYKDNLRSIFTFLKVCDHINYCISFSEFFCLCVVHTCGAR